MRWGIFADVHGNLEAWQAVLAASKKEGIDQYLCLGDLVGYGANPSECIASIRQTAAITIAGNHDWAAVDLFDLDHFNQNARLSVLWTGKKISAADRQFLQGLKLTYQRDQLTLAHGHLDNLEQFKYLLDVSSAEQAFALLETQLCFIGHSHQPIVFIRNGQQFSYTLRTKIKLRPGQAYIVNVGSVGQPRDGNPLASYLIHDSEKKELAIKRVPYDIAKAQQKIIRAGLPQFLAERLSLGR